MFLSKQCLAHDQFMICLFTISAAYKYPHHWLQSQSCIDFQISMRGLNCAMTIFSNTFLLPFNFYPPWPVIFCFHNALCKYVFFYTLIKTCNHILHHYNYCMKVKGRVHHFLVITIIIIIILSPTLLRGNWTFVQNNENKIIL